MFLCVYIQLYKPGIWTYQGKKGVPFMLVSRNSLLYELSVPAFYSTLAIEMKKKNEMETLLVNQKERNWRN